MRKARRTPSHVASRRPATIPKNHAYRVRCAQTSPCQPRSFGRRVARSRGDRPRPHNLDQRSSRLAFASAELSARAKIECPLRGERQGAFQWDRCGPRPQPIETYVMIGQSQIETKGSLGATQIPSHDAGHASPATRRRNYRQPIGRADRLVVLDCARDSHASDRGRGPMGYGDAAVSDLGQRLAPRRAAKPYGGGSIGSGCSARRGDRCGAGDALTTSAVVSIIETRQSRQTVLVPTSRWLVREWQRPATGRPE
jgi:hypothetical protein